MSDPDASADDRRRSPERTNKSPKPVITRRDTEAAFEARISAALVRLFPALDPLELTHQHAFKIQLGRKAIEVDGRPRRANGRLDILVSHGGVPLVVLELKACDENLEPDDAKQGLSYARLIDPMPPFVIVTNGRRTDWFTTHDGRPWTPTTVDDVVIKKIVEQGAAAAAQARIDAVQALLGRERGVWIAAAGALTSRSVDGLTGGIADITSPLARGFSMPRQAAAEALRRAENGAHAVALVGPALSGRTNVLAQIAGKGPSRLVPLYLRADGSRGLLQQIASGFSEELFVGVNSEQVLSWIRQAFRSPDLPRLLLLIDGVSPKPRDGILNDLEELAEIAMRGRVRMILAMDRPTLDSLSRVPGRRTSTALGRSIAQIVELEPMSDPELVEADKVLMSNGCRLLRGAEHSEEMRKPRLLRLIVAASSRTAASSDEVMSGDAVCVIPGVFSLGMLQRAWHELVPDPQIREDLRHIAAAIADDSPNLSAEARLFTHELGYLRMATAERVLGDSRFARLREFGFVADIEGPPSKAETDTSSPMSGELYLANKVPELIAAAAVGEISQRVRGAWSSGSRGSGAGQGEENGEDAGYRTLTMLARCFPLPDLVIAWVLLDVAASEPAESDAGPSLSSAILRRLLADRPRREQIGAGAHVLVGFRDKRPLPLTIDVGEEGWAMANHLPWLALSSVVGCCILADERGSYENHVDVMRTIGSFEAPLFRVYPATPDMKGTWTHEIEGVGSLACDGMGIVEPITASFRDSFATIPEHILGLAEEARAKQNLPLANRLRTAASSLTNVTDARTAELATRVEQLGDEAFKAFFRQRATQDGAKDDTRSQARDSAG